MRCRKTAYPDERGAVEAVGFLLRRGKSFRPYLGECGWWHVTSQLSTDRAT